MKPSKVLFFAAAFAIWGAGLMVNDGSMATRLALWGFGTFVFSFALREVGS